MLKHKLPERKLISFVDHEEEIEKFQNEVNAGWNITSLFFNGRSYIGILEKSLSNLSEDIIFIPPRKKIKIHS
ncbi:MAG: DUF2674 domain-containing protein [Rickettsiaceae bacterium]|nr:DUF2674 domain-containing protein [Rickettsiaceae bacterium]